MDNPQNSTGPKEASQPPSPPPPLVKLVVWELGRNTHLLFAHEPEKTPVPKNLLRVAVTNNAVFAAGMVIECRHRGADYYECSAPPTPQKKTPPPSSP
jgi:hypothetical protein